MSATPEPTPRPDPATPRPPGDALEPDWTPAQDAGEAAQVDIARLYHIHPFDERDGPDCKALYRAGLLGGKLAPNDTGLDLDDVRAAYLLDPLSGFWVAVIDDQAEIPTAWLGPEDRPGRVVGMVGVQHHEEGVGEIRRLRVHQAHRRRGLGSRLLETAIRFCREKGCLKVQLDTFVAPEAAVRLFERFHFRHGRTRKLGGKDLLYFYLDLYAQPPEA